ncbi:LIM and calponin homology domains-containing protein 1a isoform X3 [Acipenser ruthenus]|uniref:LIM and calponin homology domains-containing protein 1a isoform X3 n=1 Tax=Acipenser ruthenus TaxID=7906 RepID=UPI00274249D6|nr:LIM and calponin homology domains-containing protein 1a isoform X3 [Acipenser ruthenus]
MASPGLELEGNQHQHQHQDASPEPAFLEAQKWIEAVTGRCFGEKSFRSGLENGILLCELLNSIKPGLVKKINRLPTPLAGLDNIILFLRGCEGLGLKGTQLFDPGDLQDTSNRANIKGSDCCRKLKNVLITIYWLGKAANSCASYSGATLNLKEFEGLLSQMRKEAEDLESPKHSIRDSGYIDCWDSERSDSLSPPRHGRDDSFDSLDSFGSRSHHTPSPDVVILGSSDGRGSDSESDMPHRRMPDMRKDDMLARRTSYNEPRSAMPFNQYLPNKSNLTAYVPTPLRKKAAERQEYRKSWSTATSPIGGERPFSHPETIEEEYCETSVCYEDDGMARAEQEAGHRAAKSRVDNVQYQEIGRGHSQTDRPKESLPHKWEGKDEEEVKRLQRLEKAAVRVLPTSVRYSRPDSEESQPAPPDIILRRDNDFLKCQQEGESDSEDKEQEQRLPDIEKDDLASRKARMNQFKPKVPHNTFLPMPCSQRDEEKWENIKKATHLVTRSPLDRQQGVTRSVSMIDMRCEDEAILQPHSKARHEHLHDLHNRLLEEDDKWQDDLVRWKNRRRSASQDLIKKEEERKKVERLMSGDRDLSERRKSIKTYREIVEEKERRERELHEAYRNASSPEEAEAILRRYTQRFTVSEAVLERLEMPKFLERSVSVDSDTPSSPTKEASNPMKYLRQKSLPAPKFTATVEATISVEPQPQVSPPQTSPTRTVSTKAVPMLSPKPYSQPKNTQPALKSFKVDGMVRVNGETGEAFNGAEDERESASVKISLTKSQVMESADGANTSPVDTVIHTSPFKSQENAMVNTSPLESKVDASAAKSPEQPGTHISPVNSEEGTFGKDPAPAKPTSLPTDPCRENLVSEKQDKKETETSQKDEEHVVQALETQSRSVESSVVTQQSDADSKNFPREGHLNMPESMNCQSTVVLNTVQYSLTTKQPEQEMEDGFDSVASEKRQVTLPEIQTSYLPAEEDSGPSEENSNTPAPPFTLPKRNDYWSWDPEEERKRQERWQQEQERLLQEKYQREQDKLKQEWERAQKEVEEEERRYHEEERKILEETVAPLTPRSSTLSSPSRSDQPLLPLDPEGAIVRSLADWEHKQELLEKQAQRSKAEGCEKDEKQRETTDQPAIANEQEPTVKADEQVKVTESSHICHTETLAQSQQNDQKLLSDNSQSAVSELQFIPDASWNNKQLCTKQPEEVWRKTASLDRNWSQTSVTGGMKRSGSYENLGTTPSKSSPCSPNLQTQSPNRSISGKKVCSSCSQPLGKGAAMIIETLGLYFHIQCFKCGICNGQLGDTSTGTDVRIRNGILNCTECYIRSRTAGQPTTL